MGGFIKGVLVGVVSFGVGFVVLSIVIPVEPEVTNTAPAPVLVSPARDEVGAPQEALPEPMPQTLSEPTPDTAPLVTAVNAEDVTPVQEVQAVAPVADTPPPVPASEPSAPEEATDGLADVPPAHTSLMPDSIVVTDPSTVSRDSAVVPVDAADVVAPPAPATEGTAEVAVTLTPGGNVDAQVESQEPMPPATEAVPATVPATVPAIVPETVFVPETSVSDAPAPAPAAAQTPTTLPLRPDLPVMEATEPATVLSPVPATDIPALPTLEIRPEPVAPQDLPRVEAMPSGAPGVSVRRGVTSEPDTPSIQPARRIEGVTVGRLPRIGDSPDVAIDADSDTELAPQELAPAYLRNAAMPDVEPGTRPMGVVLIEAPHAEAALLDLPFQATIAMDPYDPDGPRRAAAYRMAGHDIALLAMGVPELANAQDIETILQVWLQAYPNVAALMDVAQNGVGARRALANNLASKLAQDGYGVIALHSGLDAFLQAAREAGLASASVYRVLDDGEQGLVTIRRLLDRAAFEAERNTRILVAGSAANVDTLTVLTDFAEGQGRSGVSLVPGSAVLRPN